MQDGVGIKVTTAGLLAAIKEVTASPPTFSNFESLLAIGGKITIWIGSGDAYPSADDLTSVSAAFSAAFKAFNKKPTEASDVIIRMMDRLIMRMIKDSMQSTTEILAGNGVRHRSHGEYTPHPLGADDIGFAGLLQTASNDRRIGPDGRVRDHLAG